jgi:hypothetical protein
MCWVIEKIAIDVSAAPALSSAVAIGVYGDGIGTPSNLLWESHSLTIGTGGGLRVVDITDVPLFGVGGQTWIAVEATSGVQVRTKLTATPHCVRAHAFGDNMPSPFSGTSTGFDAGSDTANCSDRPAPAVWLIARGQPCL